jgi:hypothetical protein
LNADWVVLLEADRGGGDVLGIEGLELLLEALADHSPHGLYSVDRYALQVVMVARSPADALAAATGEWRRATTELALPAWLLVRAEVKTPAELEAEHRAEADSLDGSASSSAGAPTSEEALRAAYDATRLLLSAESRADAAGIVTALAERLGATLVAAGTHHPDAMPLDLSLGEGELLRPAADPISMARLQLEEVLPIVLADANRVVTLMEKEPTRDGARHPTGPHVLNP